MKEKLIKIYIQKLTKQDIINYISNNNIQLNNNEIDVIYYSIKNDYELILQDPLKYLENNKYKVTNSTYLKLKELYSTYYPKLYH